MTQIRVAQTNVVILSISDTSKEQRKMSKNVGN